MTYQLKLESLRGSNRIAGLFLHPIAYLILIAATVMLFSGCEEAQRVLTSLPDGDDEAIKIGFIYSSENRSHTLNGAELAGRKLNGEGGVHGAPIKIIARGNITGEEHAVEIAEALIAEEGVSAIVGPNLSRYAVPIGEVAQQHRIPMVTTTATNPTVTAAGDFVFMSAFTDDFQGKVMARFATQDLGATTAAVLTRQGSLYSGGLSQTFIDNFAVFGGEVVQSQFYAVGDTDFTAQLTAIAESAPDVFFLPGFSTEIPLVVGQAKALGITGILLGGDSWDNAALIAGSGTFLDGSYFSTYFTANVPPGSLNKEAHEFIDTYTSIFGIPPDGGAALGYDALRLTVQAMRRAPELTATAIRDQIAVTKNYSGATFISGYDKNRHAAKSAFINRIVDGEARFYKLIQP